jgi:hypothetical protein
MEWYLVEFPKKKKARTILSAGKIMRIVFWDGEACILVHSCTPETVI